MIVVLGKWFRQGEEFSIGQWRRIGLAPGFMRDAQTTVLGNDDVVVKRGVARQLVLKTGPVLHLA